MPLSDYSPQLVFVGCYTMGAGGEGVGITAARRDPVTGALGPVASVTPVRAPSFVVRHPTKSLLYCVNERDESSVGGSVSAFGVESDGSLAPLGSWSTGGSFPCHLSLHPAEQHLLAANYGSGSVAVFALDAHGVPSPRSHLVTHSGRGRHLERQEGPHAHMVAFHDGVILAVDLGLDTVFRYRLDPETGRLGEGEAAVRTRPGAGPRHLVVDGSGRLHLVGELDASLTTYERTTDCERTTDAWRETGRVATTTAGEAFPSEVAASADGRFLYVANRGPDTIAAFSLSAGAPRLVGEVSTGGAWPRHFALVDQFLYVANERSHTVVVFRVDPVTGVPTPTGDVLATPSPSCVLAW